MSTEPVIEPTVEAPKVEGATPAEEPLGAPGLAALKSEREAKAAAEKRAAEAEARIKEFEDRDKSEIQKQQEALEKAQRELAELTVAKTRAEVAAVKGVPAGLLTGSTQEELEAAADALIAFRGEPAPAPAMQPVPTEGTNLANAGKSQLTQSDLESMSTEEINTARREGRLNKILGIN